MPGEGGNDRGHRGQIIQTILHIGFKLGLCAGRLLSTGIAFDVAVEQFIRVVLRRIGREVEKLNSILMLLQPGYDLLRVVDTKVVKDQEDFLLTVRDQTGSRFSIDRAQRKLHDNTTSIFDLLLKARALKLEKRGQFWQLKNARKKDLDVLEKVGFKPQERFQA